MKIQKKFGGGGGGGGDENEELKLLWKCEKNNRGGGMSGPAGDGGRGMGVGR